MGELLDYLTANDSRFRGARLGALYSDFRHLRTSNPDGYVANIEAWQKGLADAARKGRVPNSESPSDSLVLKIDDDLLRGLESKEWGRPLALGAVLREAIAKKELLPAKEFLTTKESIYKKSWGPSPWVVVSWGLSQIGLLGGESGEDRAPCGEVVILENLELAAKALSEQSGRYTSRTDRVMSQRLFNKTHGNLLGNKLPLSDADTMVLLKFLSRDLGLIAFDGKTLKFKGPLEETVVITQEDSTIADLKTLMGDMEAQINALSQRIATLTTSAREAITRKSRGSALAFLQSKRIAESNLSKQVATLGRLEEVYSKIGQAADQVELVRILEGSTGVLKKLNAETRGIARVENLIENLSEQMAQVDEVNSTIADVGRSGMVDEVEVDEELEAMEAAVKMKTKEAETADRNEREEQEVTEVQKQLDDLKVLESRARVKETWITQADGQDESKAVEETLKGVKKLSLEDQLSQ